MNFFFEVLIGGLLSGVMYALVAIGFVLIYKASGVFNFAQGAMVFFAALTCVGMVDKFGVSHVAGDSADDGGDGGRWAWPSKRWCCGPWSTSRRSPCSWPPSAWRFSSRAWPS